MNSHEIRIALAYITDALEDIEQILSVYSKPSGTRGIKDALVDTMLLKNLHETNDRLKTVLLDSDDDDLVGV